MVTKRIDEYDIIKGLAIIMVVVGHTACPQQVHNMCYLIHMPLFFILSGCTIRGGQNFASLQDVVKFCKKKIVSFYIPFLMFVLPICMLHNAIWNLGIYENHYDTHQYVIQIARCFAFSIGQTEPFLPQLWFLKTLFVAEILYAIIHYVCSKIGCKFWWVIAAMAISVIVLPKGSVPQALETNVIWPVKACVFMVTGTFLKLANNKKFVKWLILPFVVLWTFVAQQTYISFQHSYGIEFVEQVGISILAYYSFFYVSTIVKKTRTARLSFCYIGRKSLYIFFWHYVVFAVINIVYIHLFASPSQEAIRGIRCMEDIHWIVYVIISISSILAGEYAYRKTTHFILSVNKK